MRVAKAASPKKGCGEGLIMLDRDISLEAERLHCPMMQSRILWAAGEVSCVAISLLPLEFRLTTYEQGAPNREGEH